MITTYLLISKAQARVGGPVGDVPALDNPVAFAVGMALLFLVGVAMFVYIWWTTPEKK